MEWHRRRQATKGSAKVTSALRVTGATALLPEDRIVDFREQEKPQSHELENGPTQHSESRSQTRDMTFCPQNL